MTAPYNRSWDEAMVEAVRLAKLLDRDTEVVKDCMGSFGVRIVNSNDPIQGNVVTPNTPLTAKQWALFNGKT